MSQLPWVAVLYHQGGLSGPRTQIVSNRFYSPQSTSPKSPYVSAALLASVALPSLASLSKSSILIHLIALCLSVLEVYSKLLLEIPLREQGNRSTP